ncbi:MAG TPA: cytochrome ubiquinol oxidase subunit I [Planctomycetota bacterium]|nr:cytochrome ubiquinol oxidase subunit I [Planctomycetota bacterium]
MDTALSAHRFQFAFTIVYHYLFPQLTMGLAFLIALLKVQALRTKNPAYDTAARFWVRLFAINFAMGVVTGIPMEFQFGTNWSGFTKKAGGIVGQTLAMEGIFAFFLESSFLGLVLFGEKRLGPRGHAIATILLAFGTWLSGFFITATNAWMQHPVGHRVLADGRIELESLAAVLTNPWLLAQYPHVILGSLVTSSIVVASIGAFYVLLKSHEEQGRLFVRLGVAVGLPAALLVAFPTGDVQAKNVALKQPEAFAAMEGLFRTERGADLVLIGQPDVERMRLDNPLQVPDVLSFLTHRRWKAEIRGLEEFPRDRWPQNIPLLYYGYHIMVGLGTIFIAVLGLAALLLWRGKLFEQRWMIWTLMFLLPFPYIANTAGWITAELGRQPWLIYNILRTRDGASPNVSAGNALFTLLGFMGLYSVLSALFLLLVVRKIQKGPVPNPEPHAT